MFGALLGALKGVGSGITGGLKKLGGDLANPSGSFDWGKITQGFGQGAQAVDPNSTMGSFANAYGAGRQRAAAKSSKMGSGGPGHSMIPDSAYGEGGVLPTDMPTAPRPSVVPDSEWQPTDQPMGMTPTQGPNPDNEASMSALERLRYGQYGKYGTY